MTATDVGRGFGHSKLILLGEHAVVHGRPALAGALDVGVRVTARPGSGPRLRIPAWGLDVEPASSASDDLTRAMGRLFERAPAGARRAVAEAEPEVPSRAGLGSSAALSVAVVRALADLGGEDPDEGAVEALAGLAEEVFHGSASGIDAAMASRGGVIRFVRGEAPAPVACEPLQVAVAWVQPRVPTRDMVDRVRAALDANPAEIEAVFDEIGGLVGRAADAIARADLAGLGRLLDENHRLLARLGLSTPELDAACEAARRAGALGAKLTGAGGGGCVMALAPGRARAVEAALAGGAGWVRLALLGQR
jgi:mevalonate kinase